jgi:aspartyl-tRNA synthetase
MKIVPSFGAKGMTWMKVVSGKLDSNIVQFFGSTEQERLMDRFHAQDGDVLMMVADVSGDLVNHVLCELRFHVARRLGLIPEERYAPLWVTDFPLFELKDGEITSQHHPFTMPDRTDFDPDDREELLALKSRAYDLVMNGEELGGGSIRIHRMEIQKKIFRALGLGRDEVEEKFGFFLKALEYGTPPHGGLALGMDRVIAMILRASSIRDVIAFPKNRSAFCPLTRSPSPVDPSQIKELGLDALPGFKRAGRGIERQIYGGEGGSDLEEGKGISEEEVRHVAMLARLRLSDPEAESLRRDLDAILHYVEALKGLDTKEVPPMSHVLKMKNVWRADKPKKSKIAEALLSNAPIKERDYYKVPKILEG